jgi:YVTN family beta-propeller protein
VLVGTRAWNAELTSDNKTLYVTNGLSDDITMIDMDSRKAKKSIPVGRVPYMVLIDD